MKLKVSDLQNVCAKLSGALDSDGVNIITNALELSAESSINKLKLALTNNEYCVTATIDTLDKEDFAATVTADVFFKLINQLSTDTVEFSIVENSMAISANGTYKLPMLFEEDALLKIPVFSIGTVEKTVEISRNNMLSILAYNSKELTKGIVANPIQKLYYIDSNGCITFTSGACVNNFTISEDVPILLSSKVVNLFKLFKDAQIRWSFGNNNTASGISTRMLELVDSTFHIIAKVPNDAALIGNVPKDAIRDMAVADYPYSIVFNTNQLLNALDRLLVFMPRDMYSQPYGKFEFTDKYVTIYDRLGVNFEKLYYADESITPEDATTIILDFKDIKTTLEAVKDEKITLKFGNDVSILIQYSHITNIIPECVI